MKLEKLAEWIAEATSRGAVPVLAGRNGDIQLLEAHSARAVRVQRHQEVLAHEAVQLPL